MSSSFEKDVDPDAPFWQEVARQLHEAISKSRGRSDYRKWAPDEPRAEVQAAQVLQNYLVRLGEPFVGTLKSQRPDPPDVLLTTENGRRIGIEVTELLDLAAMREFARERKKTGRQLYDWSEWPIPKIRQGLIDLVEKKSQKLLKAQDTFDEFIVAIVTDEAIDESVARDAIAPLVVGTSVIGRVFLLLSYHPNTDSSAYPDGCVVLSIPVSKNQTPD